MYAAGRRVPAERARHAKRLGYVQAGSGPAPVLAVNANTSGTDTTTMTTQHPATSVASTPSLTSTPTQPSSSGTLPSSSPTQSSSATTSSTLPTTSSASTQSLAVTAPSSSLLNSSNPLTSPTPSSTSTPQANVAAATQSGLSGAAIAGIIAGSAIVGAALIVFFIRKTYLRRRERKHMEWSEAPGLVEPKLLPDVGEPPAPSTSAANTQQGSAAQSPFEIHGQPMYSILTPPVVHTRPSIPTYAVPTPPLATYNNPAAYPTQPVPSTYGPGGFAALATGRAPAGTGATPTLPAIRAQHAPMEAIVKYTFVPTLPDELSITTGERIFIIEQYDDGWDLCANRRGERGVVPRECLERAPSDQPDIGWKNERRTSSLNPDGRRF